MNGEKVSPRKVEHRIVSGNLDGLYIASRRAGLVDFEELIDKLAEIHGESGGVARKISQIFDRDKANREISRPAENEVTVHKYTQEGVIVASSKALRALKRNLDFSELQELEPEKTADLPLAIDRLVYLAVSKIETAGAEDVQRIRRMGHIAALLATVDKKAGYPRQLTMADVRIRYPDLELKAVEKLYALYKENSYEPTFLHGKYIENKLK